MFMEKAHGGKRLGAGRPKGSGRYGEKTLPIRVPESLINEIRNLVESRDEEPSSNIYKLPLYGYAVSAGVPTFADDHVDETVDLNSYLAPRPDSTFCLRVQGDSMINASIHEGDILIVDKSLQAKAGKIVIASVDGHLTVKRLHKEAEKMFLMPENDKYTPIELTSEQHIVILGVVTSVLHEV